MGGYAVYAVNECDERIGNALATVRALGIEPGTQSCCNSSIYKATIRMQLPVGATSQKFMVVPTVFSLGALDVGWVTPAALDNNVQSPAVVKKKNAPAPPPPEWGPTTTIEGTLESATATENKKKKAETSGGV